MIEAVAGAGVAEIGALKANLLLARDLQALHLGMNGTIVLILACGLLCGCGNKKTPQAEKSFLTNNNTGNPLSAPADYLGAVNQARKFAVKRIDIAQILNAIGLFNGQEDRYPRNLDELVAKHYLQSLPQLPPGARFDYNPQTGDIRVVQQ